MKDHDYFRLIFAVGSLPFWTGLKKLRRFLLGQPGSFWKGETPLKPIYLNHYFFSTFAAKGRSYLSRMIQNLIESNYLTQTQLSKKLPARVIKLTDRGVKQYYNQLVNLRQLKEPAWHLHHVAQLNSPPRSAIATGGELLEFSGRLYVSQTPEFVELQQRVSDESTLELISQNDQQPEPANVYKLEEIEVKTGEGVKLELTEKGSAEAVSGADLREALTHFPNPQVAYKGENPFILRGELVEIDKKSSHPQLLFEKEKAQIFLRYSQGSEEELDLETGKNYCFGPLEPKIIERRRGKIPVVELDNRGTIEPASPII